ncbi:MAG: hypothetical protein M1813_006430 [Trichoglossum hirsutum]|nr:MAG: hypothetical protein M1813_007441 [Trichoglossum hirsutum]KAI9859887.1 MAG: hypothetical protein M1813_006430 [Trichoglossum hirsutum]
MIVPRSSISVPSTLILLILLITPQVAAQTPTSPPWAEITAFPPYWDLRNCAGNCLIDFNSCLSHPSSCPLANRTSVDAYLNCETLSCMCKPLALTNGTNWVATCVLKACGDSAVDANATVKVYKDICAKEPPERASGTSSQNVPTVTLVTPNTATVSPPITNNSLTSGLRESTPTSTSTTALTSTSTTAKTSATTAPTSTAPQPGGKDHQIPDLTMNWVKILLPIQGDLYMDQSSELDWGSAAPYFVSWQVLQFWFGQSAF